LFDVPNSVNEFSHFDLYNRTNVKLSPYALGYLPFMLPFSQPMTIEEAGCCWCANTTGTDFEAFQKNPEFQVEWAERDIAGKNHLAIRHHDKIMVMDVQPLIEALRILWDAYWKSNHPDEEEIL
jgi:hypothetical protein